MNNIQERQLYEQFEGEFRVLCEDKQPVILELTKLQAWSLLSQLQLALRHPENKGPTSDIAREIAGAIQEKIATSPALAEVARRGWDKRYDE